MRGGAGGAGDGRAAAAVRLVVGGGAGGGRGVGDIVGVRHRRWRGGRARGRRGEEVVGVLGRGGCCRGRGGRGVVAVVHHLPYFLLFVVGDVVGELGLLVSGGGHALVGRGAAGAAAARRGIRAAGSAAGRGGVRRVEAGLDERLPGV